MKCYSFGHYVGKVTPAGRSLRSFGRATFWVAEDEAGLWQGSYRSKEQAMEEVFAVWERRMKFRRY